MSAPETQGAPGAAEAPGTAPPRPVLRTGSRPPPLPPSRRARTTRMVLAFSVLVVLACVGWAMLVQVAVPDACSAGSPQPRAQYLHC